MQPPVNSNPGVNSFPSRTSNPTFAQTQANPAHKALLDAREETVESAGYTVLRQSGEITEGDDMLLHFHAANASLASGGTYFLGGMFSKPQTGTEGKCKIHVLREGTIKRVAAQILADGNFSNEPVSLYLRKNGTTDYLISDALDFSLLTQDIVVDVEIPMARGDYFEMKFVTPTWNSGEGEGCPISGQVYLQ